MFKLWRTEKHIEELMHGYVVQVTSSLDTLKRVFPQCLDGSQAQRDDFWNPVHKLESVADDMRRDLERELLSGKLLPQSRADLLAILEATDHVPNTAEDIVDLFTIQKVDVPAALRDDMHQLLLKTLEACAAMTETLMSLLQNLEQVRELRAEVDRLESECDRLERHLLHRVFSLELDLARKLHLRDLVRTVARLADQAENVADMAYWMALKRRP
jgi:predicted phosphate transport protein (TIGR00153 family)